MYWMDLKVALKYFLNKDEIYNNIQTTYSPIFQNVKKNIL